jgi:hypothetical protein
MRFSAHDTDYRSVCDDSHSRAIGLDDLRRLAGNVGSPCRVKVGALVQPDATEFPPPRAQMRRALSNSLATGSKTDSCEHLRCGVRHSATVRWDLASPLKFRSEERRHVHS